MSNRFMGADYLRILDFVREKHAEGNIVIIASQVTNECRLVTDFTEFDMLPGREIWRPNQFYNWDFSVEWDLDRSGQPSQEYHQLREVLGRDEWIPKFEHRLRRTDGSLCLYQSDFFYADNFLCEPVRISVARPEDWQLLEAANPDFAIDSP